jgi:uncharacterized damage-inducible protein DinB
MSIEEYKKDLVTVFEGKPWYGKCVLHYIEKLEGKDLSKKLSEGNNVAQIIEHMISWRHWGLQMFKGNYDYWIKADSNQDWQRETSYSEEDLNQLVSKLKQSQNEILDEISKKEDIWLSEMIPERKFTFGEALNGIIQHDIYHLGQIALLTKN